MLAQEGEIVVARRGAVAAPAAERAVEDLGVGHARACAGARGGGQERMRVLAPLERLADLALPPRCPVAAR